MIDTPILRLELENIKETVKHHFATKSSALSAKIEAQIEAQITEDWVEDQITASVTEVLEHAIRDLVTDYKLRQVLTDQIVKSISDALAPSPKLEVPTKPIPRSGFYVETYEGRKICELEDLGAAYIGSVKFEYHCRQIDDPCSWVQSAVPRWLEAYNETVGK